MKRHPLVMLLLVMTVAAVVWIFERPVPSTIQLFPDLDPMGITRLQLTHFLDSVTLEKRDKDWWVAGAGASFEKADPWKVGAAIRRLKTLESQSIISRDASLSPRLNANIAGTRVEAYDARGQLQADLTIGKVGPDLVSSAVRRGGDKTVYLVKGYLAEQFSPLVDQWKARDEKNNSGSDALQPDAGAAPGRQ